MCTILVRSDPTAEVLNPPAINPMLERQLDLALQFMQDIGGQQDASMGKLPSASISGAP